MHLRLVQTIPMSVFETPDFNWNSTKVSREVFPEPLGPIKMMEGRVTSPLVRKTKLWSRIGMEMASRMAMMRPSGEGVRRAYAHCCIADEDIITSLREPALECQPFLELAGLVLCCWCWCLTGSEASVEVAGASNKEGGAIMYEAQTLVIHQPCELQLQTPKFSACA